MTGGKRPALHRSIWMLGFVSLLMDTSSEMIHSLLPLFLVTVLGASAMTVGWIEGVAEAATHVVKLFSGAISDRVGRRKPLVLLGYGMAALSKPLFPLAGGIGAVFAARFLDRIGKGIRGAPRDALIADITDETTRGAAYGLRQSLDTVGAIAGPALALLFMWWLAEDFRAVFWIAVIPAVLCVLLIWFGVEEPDAASRKARRVGPRLTLRQSANLGRTFWIVVAIGAAMTLARFSEAFLILRAQDLGFAAAMAPVVMIVMNVAYAGSSYPVGVLADRVDRRTLLLIGFALLLASDLALAFADGTALLVVGVILWGLHMGFTQGLLAAMVADAAPADRRGSAFGAYYLVSGVAMLLASVIAGVLWTAIGPQATFFSGAILVAVAGVLAILFGHTARP
jgi:MFS family permease